MSLKENILNGLIRFLLNLFFKIDMSELKKLTQTGPAILITNHVSNLEGPILYVNLRPRKTIAMAKAELFNHFFTKSVLKTWGAIPVKRGAADMTAMKSCFKVLEEGNFLCIAPEGTRSKTGKLLRGKAGTTFIATQNKVAIIPIAHWGINDFGSCIKRFRRARVTIRMGKPFFVEKKEVGRINSNDRQKMADEMMFQISTLLPEQYRGYYGDLTKMTTDYLTFTDI